jgi:multiple sugar transport system ATP-binding protein
MAQVRLNRVSKRFGKHFVVKDVTLDIQDGEFLVLLGPSGCGKTTTMRMIAGLEEITEGQIYIGGRLVNNVEPKGRDISMVFQNYGLYPNLTVYENIRFPLKVRKVPRAQHHERVMRAIETVELTQFVDRRPAQLSGGQRQRVALGRAIVREPSVFLMDEPLSNLDAKLRISTRAQLKHLHHKLRTTTVYVTHDQIEAMTLADRVVVMQEGAIQQIGSPSEIYGSPANTFVAGFIGSPAMNLIEGTVTAGVFEAPGMRIASLRADVEGKVTLGFRAEDASVVDSDGQLVAPVYSTELLGEASMISFRFGAALVSVRAAKDYRVAIADLLHINVPPEACHLYNSTSGVRIGSASVLR